MSYDPSIAVYFIILAVIGTLYVRARWYAEMRSRATRAKAEAQRLEPASLHPKIDPAKCLGCGACAHACPEGGILGVINGNAELIEPNRCIGHGSCQAACPYGAITLVFGTATRGIDIPDVGPDFQTNVPGIFIAGELGGMGLIRNAIEQGSQAIASIRKLPRPRSSNGYDVIIVGAGPAGFAASLAAVEHNLRYLTLEQDSFGGSIAHFPRRKVIMTTPATLPLVGTLKFKTVSKERLLTTWAEIADKVALRINYGEQVDGIDRLDAEFEVRTTRGLYRSASVLLAIGRRGTPRKLDVEGEDQTKVVYRLADPQQYRQQCVLVVGGGDSAIEAATRVAEEPDVRVTLCCRGVSFSHATSKNRELVESAAKSGRLCVLLQSRVKRIGRHHVEIEQMGRPIELRNNAVIVCAGGILPSAFLRSAGVEFETKYGTA